MSLEQLATTCLQCDWGRFFFSLPAYGILSIKMLFHPTTILGVLEVEPELKEDERGYFARIFGEDEFQKQGIDFRVRQANRSFNKTKGTVRGMHFQKPPKWEAKLMMPLTGSFYVIVADLRPESSTFKQWVGIELSAEKKRMLLAPVGCANGFQTLENNSEMLYFMSDFYSPEHASGISYQDPQFQFVWPLGEPTVISPKDAALPNFSTEIL